MKIDQDEYNQELNTKDMEMTKAVERMELAFNKYKEEFEELTRTCDNYRTLLEREIARTDAYKAVLVRLKEIATSENDIDAKIGHISELLSGINLD